MRRALLALPLLLFALVPSSARSLGSFTLVGSCSTHISYGATFERCRFKGRQPWLFRIGF